MPKAGTKSSTLTVDVDDPEPARVRVGSVESTLLPDPVQPSPDLGDLCRTEVELGRVAHVLDVPYRAFVFVDRARLEVGREDAFAGEEPLPGRSRGGVFAERTRFAA